MSRVLLQGGTHKTGMTALPHHRPRRAPTLKRSAAPSTRASAERLPTQHPTIPSHSCCASRKRTMRDATSAGNATRSTPSARTGYGLTGLASSAAGDTACRPTRLIRRSDVLSAPRLASGAGCDRSPGASDHSGQGRFPTAAHKEPAFVTVESRLWHSRHACCAFASLDAPHLYDSAGQRRRDGACRDLASRARHTQRGR